MILLLSIVASHHHAVTHHMAVRIISLMPWHFVLWFHVITLVVVCTVELDSMFSIFEMLSCPERFLVSREDICFQRMQTLVIPTVSQRQHSVDVLVPSEGVLFSSQRFFDVGSCCQKCVQPSMTLKLPLFPVHCRVDAVVTALVSENLCGL